jgi:hypothetical protein
VRPDLQGRRRSRTSFSHRRSTPLSLEEALARIPSARKCGAQWMALCPAHEDHSPSLSLDQSEDGRLLLHCHAGCTFDAILRQLGSGVERLHDSVPASRFERRPPQPSVRSNTDSSELAAIVWGAALRRARDDAHAREDGDVYEYLGRRGLMESFEDGAFGVLGADMRLPAAVASWPHRGYRLVVPLYGPDGQLTAVQARSITNSSPKTLFHPGAKVSGSLFANRAGLELMRGSWHGAARVVMAEGLTDFLALSVLSEMPVFGAAGTSFVAPGIGPWVRSMELILALDNDAAGNSILKPASNRAFECGAERVGSVRWPSGCKDACDALVRVGRVRLDRLLGHEAEEVRRG